jgi:methylenetetrahydrofolate dehydrogenase (NADP+)/methenyltetrahydrofolate cyclohydrolase
MDPDKDVDGLHPVNLGRLALGVPGPVPCTPAGIEALLAYYEIPVSGREVVILGRGFTLGRPLVDAAVAEAADRERGGHGRAHRRTDWPRYTQRPDIVIAGCGGARASSNPSTSGPDPWS